MCFGYALLRFLDTPGAGLRFFIGLPFGREFRLNPCGFTLGCFYIFGRRLTGNFITNTFFFERFDFCFELLLRLHLLLVFVLALSLSCFERFVPLINFIPRHTTKRTAQHGTGYDIDITAISHLCAGDAA